MVNHLECHSYLSEKSKLFNVLTAYSLKLKENVFDYLPLTFFVEVNIDKQKSYTKAMLTFMYAFYALDDIKKRTNKYFQKYD